MNFPFFSRVSLLKIFGFTAVNILPSMVKWKDSWLKIEDSNGVRLNLWLQKDDEYHG